MSETTINPTATQGRIQIRNGLLFRLRQVHAIASEDEQARLIGVDRSTLRRVDEGGQPSGAFMAGLCVAFGLSLGEAFEVVAQPRLVAGAAAGSK